MTMPAQNAQPEPEVDPNELGQEATATGASMNNARLGGQEGVGTLQVVRGRDSEVMEIRGTWRSKDDRAEDEGALAQLCEAFASGESVPYQGPLVDPDSDRDRVKVDVELTSTERYEFDTGEKEASEKADRRIFNFRPVDGKKALNL